MWDPPKFNIIYVPTKIQPSRGGAHQDYTLSMSGPPNIYLMYACGTHQKWT